MEDYHNTFENYTYNEISYRDTDIVGNIIRAEKVSLAGTALIEVEEEGVEGVRIILKKDQNSNVREIKFVCSCGQTKTIALDYAEES